MVDISTMETPSDAMETEPTRSPISDDAPGQESAEDRCFLLELPRELRDEIIKEALIQDQHHPDIVIISDQKILCPLMLISKQIRAETLPLFYQKKTFCIHNLNKNTDFWTYDRSDKQLTRTERWLGVIHLHLCKIERIQFSLCEGHHTFLELCAAPGKPVIFDIFECDESLDGGERRSYLKGGTRYICDIGTDWDDNDFGVDESELQKSLRALCNSVGGKGFGPGDYMRALKLFLCPMRNRCPGDDEDDPSCFCVIGQ